MKRLAALPWLVVGLGGCNGLPATEPVPAILLNPSPVTQAAVETAIREVLGRSDFRLAADAFVTTSRLNLEPRLAGRDLGRPEQLQLLLKGSTCFVRHQSGRTARVAAPCRPE